MAIILNLSKHDWQSHKLPQDKKANLSKCQVFNVENKTKQNCLNAQTEFILIF